MGNKDDDDDDGDEDKRADIHTCLICLVLAPGLAELVSVIATVGNWLGQLRRVRLSNDDWTY